MIAITVTDDQGQRKELRFDADRIRIGRDADNDVVLDSQASSRHHAEIVRQAAGIYKIIDLGSANGIKIGDSKVPDLFLTDGMSVVLGVHTLAFAIDEPAAAKTLLLDPGVMAQGLAEEAERRRAPQPLYLLHRQHGQTRSLKIVPGTRYTIGRSPDADLVVDSSLASKRHAVIQAEGDRFLLQDLESSNGTLLNGRVIHNEPLSVGDEIFIGNEVIVVQDQRLELEDDAVLLGKTRLQDFSTLRQSVPAKSVDRETGRRLGPMLFVAAALVLAIAAFFVLRPRPDGALGGAPEALSAPAPADGVESLTVHVATVETKELARAVRGSGNVTPHRTVKVSAEIPGQVVAVFVDEGSVVAPGDLLVQIDDTDLRLRLDEARSAVSKGRVDLAKEDYERMQSLFEKGVISRAVVDRSESEYLSLDSAYRSAQAKTRQLQEQLRKALVKAPISGRVARRSVNQGEFLALGAPVAILENMQDVLVVLEVSDREIVKVEPGQAVEAAIDAFPDRVFRGVVDSAATAANPQTRTFKVEARIDNSDGSLRSGMIAALRILVEESRALVIPVEALLDPEETEAAVFVVAGELARRRSIVLGERWDREVEVLSGLTSGDAVITSGKERVSDGEAVRVYRGP